MSIVCNQLRIESDQPLTFSDQHFPRLSALAHVREETSALLFVITQIFKRGTDGKCTTCDKAEGDHYHHSNGTKYCYVSTTCPPPHVFVLRASGMY